MTDAADIRALIATAAAEDPSLEPGPAQQLLLTCLQILDSDPSADAAEVARRCVVRHPDADASWIVHLARAATRVRKAAKA